MPTTRPRHQITETDAVARAIDAAAERWPEDADNRAKLLHRLIEAGYLVVAERREDAARARRSVIRSTAGVLEGCYPPGYLDELHADWPE